MAYRILTLNKISPQGLARLPAAALRGGTQGRVTRMRCWCARRTCTRRRFRAAVRAIGRAGAGVNNIPVAQMSRRGIVVFNAPGANANAVKELVLAGLLLAARNICPGMAVRPQPCRR